MRVGLGSLLPSLAIILIGATVGPAGESTASGVHAASAPRAAVVPCTAPAPPTTPATPGTPVVTSPTQPPSGTGRAGTGLVFDRLPSSIAAPIGPPVTGQLRMATANIPNRTGDPGFKTSMQRLVSTSPDFITLNEISRHSDASLTAPAPGYSVYRDPVRDRSVGGAMSMENAVLWRAKTWRLLDGGRVKIADNDQGYHSGHPFTWDRYATWATFQRVTDGAVVSVISTHMMTNPVLFPRQHGTPSMTRKQQFDLSMKVTTALVQRLAVYGPVLMGGDMNSHPNQGSWTTVAHMVAAGYGYTKDQGVMYDFFPDAATVASTHEFAIVSDHHALATALNMNGVAGTGVPTGDPSGGASGGASGGPTSAATPGPPTMPSGEQLTTSQLDNAATLIARGRAAKLPRAAWVAAIAASLVETDLSNLAPSSGAVGIFRQRPARGWGTAQELSTPSRAADAFYGTASHSTVKGLTDYPWQTMTVPEIDGAVLGSVFPERFAEREADAQFVTQYVVSGGRQCSGTGLGTCPAAKGVSVSGKVSTAARTVIDCAHRAFPRLTRFVGTGLGRYCDGDRLVSGLDIPLSTARSSYLARSAQDRGAQLAHFLQLHSADLGVNFIVFAGRTWAAGDPAAGWRPYAASDGSRSKTALVFDRVYVAVKGGSC